jgi:hypothetical protein
MIFVKVTIYLLNLQKNLSVILMIFVSVTIDVENLKIADGAYMSDSGRYMAFLQYNNSKVLN